MTCPLLLRRPQVDGPTAEDSGAPQEHSCSVLCRLAVRLGRDDAVAQFARFVFVGGLSSTLYATLFLAFQALGDQPANLLGAAAASVLANELHRRLTFHAGERVSWFTAQWEGGGTALVGMVATTTALGWLDAVAGDTHVLLRLALIGAVTGTIGLLRFVALRWLFHASTPRRA